MMDLRELYQDIILDHGQHPRNKRAIDHPSHFAHGNNPLCGDKVTVYLKMDGTRVDDVSFEGRGCAISTASASLLTESIKGKTEREAEALFDRFRELVTQDDVTPHPGLGKLEVLAGVREFPVRVKCATLAWHTLRAALAGRHEPVSTE